jgi:DNA replication protein DnaC
MNPFRKTIEDMPGALDITLHPDRCAQDQIQAALATVQALHCNRHPHELVALDTDACLKEALRETAKIEFTAIFERCSHCPHDFEDIEIEAINCKAEDCRFWKHLAQYDQRGKPLPWTAVTANIQPDQTRLDRFTAWLTRLRAKPIQCRDEPLRLRAGVPPEAQVYSCPLIFLPCPTCVLQGLGLSSEEARASFDNFVCDPPVLGDHLAVCRQYADDPKGVFLMLGNTGGGKTHLAASILRERIRQKAKNLLFRKARHLFDEHWQSIRPVSFDAARTESPLQDCRRASLLVLDDLGKLPGHFDAEGFLLDLFEARIGQYRPTIITSNLSRAELEEAIGSRLFDRLRQAAFAVLEFGFESKRSSMNTDYLTRCST